MHNVAHSPPPPLSHDVQADVDSRTRVGGNDGGVPSDDEADSGRFGSKIWGWRKATSNAILEDGVDEITKCKPIG